ncbi:MAG: DUF434 domain-containing protein [Coriobacteriales bacterium]|nr:DUF434 domain-containing protein [Coriobacteriales bacterium]
MQAKRGYVPKDDRFFGEKAQETLRVACKHVCYLINNGYGLKQASTFVGDHFQLSDRQRTAIVRSVATTQQLDSRRAKEVSLDALGDQAVWIDGFNTIITLEVMLSDSTLLSCMDGSVRDLAALRGTYRIIPVTVDAIGLLFGMLRDAGVRSATVLLDQPVSNSGRLGSLLREVGEAYPFVLDVRVQNGVDRTLYGRENVISSDSVILDHCVGWVNLTRHCLELQGNGAIRVW